MEKYFKKNNRMILAKHIVFSGGLGNQMFQYAFLLSMREKGIACSIDTSLFSICDMHNGFELINVFGLSERIKKPSALHIRWIQVLNKYKYILKTIAYKDQVYHFCGDAYKCRQLYMFGDWISEEYFRSIRGVILNAYEFKNISLRNISLSDEIKNKDSVSIHIRRGDYLNLPNYCVCDECYYEKAIRHIQENVSSPFFYVFSNAPMWCEDFMRKFNVPFKIVDWNQGKDSYQDMYLMTQCKHNIIANSTFSWWGAWLNQNDDKIVVAPRNWFKYIDNDANCRGWYLIDAR